MRIIHHMPRNEMRVEDIRRVLIAFINRMPKTYRKRTANASVVMDIIQSYTGQAGFSSCCDVCRRIGCDPDAYEFPKWGLEDIGGKYVEVDDGGGVSDG